MISFFFINFSDSVRIINLIKNCIQFENDRLSFKFQTTLSRPFEDRLSIAWKVILIIKKNVFGSKTGIYKRCAVPNAQVNHVF